MATVISPRILRVHHQQREVHLHPNSDNYLSGIHNQLNHHATNSTSGQSEECALTLSSNAFQAKSVTPIYCSNLGPARVISASHMASSSSYAQATGATESDTGTTKFPTKLRGGSESLASLETGAAMVDTEHRTLQWKPCHDPSTRSHDLHGCAKTGMGCNLRQSASEREIWSATEKLLHINILELKGAFLAIQALLKNKRSMTVSLNMDNSSAVAYINHKGGTHSPQLLYLTLALWEWCIQRDIFLVAHHVPGKSNSLADRESRVFLDNSDWMLDPNIIRPLLGPCQTDLFATRLTHQLPIYVSWRPDPKALQSDAFSLNWKGLKGYAFPPFNLIAKVLNKILEDQTEILLVAPIWQAQPWWPLLLQLLTQQPVLLPVSPHLLIDPSDPEAIHPMYPRLHLGVFPISYNVTKQKAFQQTLPNYLSQPLDPPHIRRTNQAGSAGAAGVVHEKLILFRHR